MPMSAAERMRKYRERIKKDPKKLAETLHKWKDGSRGLRKYNSSHWLTDRPWNEKPKEGMEKSLGKSCN